MRHLVVRPHGSGASRQRTLGRARPRRVTRWQGGCPRGEPCRMRRWLRRSVLRTDFPALLTPGSCGATHFARCARFVQTQRRKPEVRSALRAPTPGLRCSAPQTAPHPTWLAPWAAPLPASDAPRPGSPQCSLPLRKRRWYPERRRSRCPQIPQGFPQRRGAAARAARIVHHSRGDCPSGARAASAASFAAPAGAASIAGHPREAGASTRHAGRRRPHAFARTTVPGSGLRTPRSDAR